MNAAAALVYARAPRVDAFVRGELLRRGPRCGGRHSHADAGYGLPPAGLGLDHLDGAFVPKDSLIGEEGSGLSPA